MLSSLEPFDRGFYSGPFGWLGGQGAEFAVAIRSALFVPEVQAPEFPGVQALGPTAMRVALYAGVGIVPGSKASLEWAELDLKVAALDRLLTPVPALQQARKRGSQWGVRTSESAPTPPCPYLLASTSSLLLRHTSGAQPECGLRQDLGGGALQAGMLHILYCSG